MPGIDASVVAARAHEVERNDALVWVGAELALVAAMLLIQRTLGMFRSLLRQQLGQRINVEILDKEGHGEVRVRYATLEQLDEVCRRLSRH